MFLKRKPRNRRFERHHVLDVKLSAIQRRRIWIQRLAIGLGILFLASFALLIFSRGGAALLDRVIFNNPAFAIHHLEVETDGVFSLEQLRAWAGVRLRDNLMAVDLARIKRDLELVPAIENVMVERVLPHTLRIRVTERVPIAQVTYPLLRAGGTAGGAVYTLDAKGFFMFPVEPQQRAAPAPTNAHFPLIVGLPPAEVRPGRQTELPQVLAALQFIQAFERSALGGWFDVKQIDVSLPNVLQVTTSQNSEVILGLSNLDLQLRRWRAVHEHGQKIGKQIAWIDFSVANNVPSRWVEANPEPPPPAKTNQPPVYSKKHV